MKWAALLYYHLVKRTGLVERGNYSHFNSQKKFDRLYALDADPFGVERSEYEERKALDFAAILSKERYATILDIGCGTGRMTRRLATRGSVVLGIDFSNTAIARAREYCADLPTVTFDAADIRHYSAPTSFDLIVCSEVLYYLSGTDLDHAIGSIRNASRPQSEIIVVTRLDHVATRDALERVFTLEKQIERDDEYRPYTISRYRVR